MWLESAAPSQVPLTTIFSAPTVPGHVMDKLGRLWIAVPCMVILDLGTMLLPLSRTALALGGIAIIMSFGNGISRQRRAQLIHRSSASTASVGLRRAMANPVRSPSLSAQARCNAGLVLAIQANCSR